MWVLPYVQVFFLSVHVRYRHFNQEQELSHRQACAVNNH